MIFPSGAIHSVVVNVDVVGVCSIRQTAIAVGETKSPVSSSGADVVAIDETDLGVDGSLQQQAGLSTILSNDGSDSQTVDIPGLNSMASCSGNANSIHLDI